MCGNRFSNLQLSGFPLIPSKQRRLVKVQRERSGRRRQSSVQWRNNENNRNTGGCSGLSSGDPLGQVQDLQQQPFVPAVLRRSAGVQLEWRSLEERQGFSQRPQLYQVQEVEVPEPLGSLASRQLWVETPAELQYIVTPFLLEPAVCRKQWHVLPCVFLNDTAFSELHEKYDRIVTKGFVC